ncbi:MAG: NAD(+) synthase, partial [Clostridium sp.]|nr:NAD(+) synthase [Clostridium sp.]
FKDIGNKAEIHDVTYENVQARERTQILMDLANKKAALLVGTGDLSELALGWATYNGDHMSMYSVNCSVPKTLVRYLVKYVSDKEVAKEVSDILVDILDTPVSPELLPKDKNGEISQKTEDIVGPYELHDFFLYYFIRQSATPEKILFLSKEAFKDIYDNNTIEKWFEKFIKRFFTQQFKRSALPDGPKVGTISLSPRGDWRMPSDADFSTWI